MELQFPSVPALFSFFILLFMIIKFVNRARGNDNLPPGPPKLPIIGNLHQLMGSPPHHTVRDLTKDYGPLMHLKLGSVSTIIVSSAEMAKEVMKTHDVVFAQRPQLLASKIMSYDYTDIGFAPYGNYWRHLRKICMMELLSPSRVQSFRSVREKEALNLIETINSSIGYSSKINLSEKIFSSTYSITSTAAFGKKCKGQDAFLTIFTELTKLPSGLSLADLYPSIEILQHIGGLRTKLEAMHREADRVLQNIVNEHRQSRIATICGTQTEEDLVDVFLKLQENGDPEFPLTDTSIKAVLLDMFTSGIETTSTTLEWAMSEMLKNPKVLKEAQTEVRCVFMKEGNVDESKINEIQYLKCVIKETLRLHPPLPLLLPRESSQLCEINGFKIPAKTRLMVNAWAIARDPNNWNEPEKFKPERFFDKRIDFKGTNFEYIPFGAGRRVCPGISFAVCNIELPLAQLLLHFDWKLPGGVRKQDLDMSEATGLTVRRKKDLVLVPTLSSFSCYAK